MDFAVISSLKSRKNADVLVVPFWKGKKTPQVATEGVSFLDPYFKQPIAIGDFEGKEGEILIHYVSGEPEKRLIMLGLGSEEGINIDKLRKTYAQVVKLCHKKKSRELNLFIPECKAMSKEDLLRGVCEGLLLSNYVFSALKHDTLKENPQSIVEKVTFIGLGKNDLALIQKYAIIAESVNMVRDLVNGNADDVTPQYLGAVARGLEKTCSHIKTTVFDKKWIEKEKMGLILAVNRGSVRDPVFIIIEYRGNPKSQDHTVIVGKGITFDTGGLNLKLTGMETMKADMAGAGASLGIIHAVASIGLKVNVTAVIPATENSIDANSYKPADVYKSYLGKTVEIGNTDAEGRLILADALAYAVQHLKPSRLIDLATLTGAVEVALGDEITGLLSNNDALADLLIRAGSETGEKVWRLPLAEEYKEALKSDVADIKSTGGRAAGCIKAALFLQQFVGNIPWAHLDIAGTAFISETKSHLPKHATGVGVRLILSLLEIL